MTLPAEEEVAFALAAPAALAGLGLEAGGLGVAFITGGGGGFLGGGGGALPSWSRPVCRQDSGRKGGDNTRLR